MRPGNPGGCFHLGIGGVQPPVADVITDCPGKQVRGLEHNTARLEALQCVVGVIAAVNADKAALRFIETTEQVDDGGLTTTGWPNQGDVLTRFDLQREIGQNRLAILIVEIHVVEFDLASDGFSCKRIRAILDFRGRVNQLKYPFRRSNGMLHIGINTRQILHWPDHKCQVRNERIQ